jgi:hypothetical protein
MKEGAFALLMVSNDLHCLVGKINILIKVKKNLVLALPTIKDLNLMERIKITKLSLC